MFFSMDDVNKVMTMNISDAKVYVSEIVNDTITATGKNKFKAKQLINKSNTVVQLATGMSNFILAHTDNRLGVI